MFRVLRERAGLWNHPDFLKLWFGQTISMFGSRTDALALTAVLVLAATPEQMGLFMALISLPVIVLGLLAGAWVDRLRRRPIMIVSDVARFVILLTVPIAYLTGTLTFELVCVVAMLTSVFSLFFNLAYRAMLPSLVEREHLLEGNTKLATTDSLAEIGGPSVGGLLVQLLTAPIAVLVDAFSFLISALSFATIRKPEPQPEPSADANVLREIGEGMRVIISHPVLRTIAINTTSQSFFGSFYAVLYSLFVIRDLGLSPAVLGLAIAAGGIGALPGSLLAGWLARRYSLGRVLTTSLLIGSLIGLLTPLAGGPAWLAAGFLIASQILGDATRAVYEVNETTLRQMTVPDRLLGRAEASIGFMAQVVSPLGALICGLIAGLTGARVALLIAVLGSLATAVWIASSPLRTAEIVAGGVEVNLPVVPQLAELEAAE